MVLSIIVSLGLLVLFFVLDYYSDKREEKLFKRKVSYVLDQLEKREDVLGINQVIAFVVEELKESLKND